METITNYQMDFITGLAQIETDFLFMSMENTDKTGLEEHFKNAIEKVKGAFIDAVSKARPALLEPIVNIEITAPADNMGDITGDMASRRGRVSGQDMLPGGMILIKAQVPLSEVTQYNSQLKSVTAGQGSYSMELSHYEPTPPNVQQQVVAQYKKEKQAEASH